MLDQYLVNKPYNKSQFLNGIKAGTSIAIGYIPIGIAYGLLAKSFNLPVHIVLLMSFMVFAGASQFIAVNLIIAGSTYIEIIIATFILNLRHLLMSASLSQRLPDWLSKHWLALLAFGVTDETFSVASIQKDKSINPQFLFGLNLIAFISWNIGSAIGIFLAVGLPQSIQNSMGIALYAMFIGLLVPSLKHSNPIKIIVLIAIIISSILHWLVPYFISISSGWNIIITTILSSIVGAILFPTEGEQHE